MRFRCYYERDIVVQGKKFRLLCFFLITFPLRANTDESWHIRYQECSEIAQYYYRKIHKKILDGYWNVAEFTKTHKRGVVASIFLCSSAFLLCSILRKKCLVKKTAHVQQEPAIKA